MRISLKDNRLIFICSSISIVFVIACYVASQWYYSRWDVAPFVFTENDESDIQRLQSFNDVYIGADDPSSRSSEIVTNIQTFEALIYDHPLVQYNAYDEKELRRRFKKATDDSKTEIAWEIIDQFDNAHDFMIRLMELYGEHKLPFEKGSEPYLFIEKMINSYTQFVEEAEDPFMIQAFQDLEQRITAAQQQRESDPEWIKQNNAYKRTLGLVKQIESEINAPGYDFDKVSTNTPWTMPSPSNAMDSSMLGEDLNELSSSEVFSTDETLPVSKNVADTLFIDSGFTHESDSDNGEPLSLEHFDKALQLIDQFGTEEGLRRLREMDPDAADRFERERRGVSSRDAPPGHTHPDGQSHDDSP